MSSEDGIRSKVGSTSASVAVLYGFGGPMNDAGAFDTQNEKGGDERISSGENSEQKIGREQSSSGFADSQSGA